MFSFRTTALENQLDKALTDGKVGCFCTQNCWDTERESYMYQLFQERGNLEIVLTPKDTELCSLTNHIEFAKEQIENLSAVVVEIQDVGSRYFNYSRDVFRLMSMLNEMGDSAPAMYVIDHINPAGRFVEGTVPTGTSETFVPKVAHRHGLTLGELCNLYSSEISARFSLHIISANAVDSNRLLMPWTIAPASDIPGLFTSLMYSGGALWNNTTITPGIGTARPYEYFGAPFLKYGIDTLPAPEGVIMRPCTFSPSTGQYAGERCCGYQIILQPGVEYHSLLHTLQLIRYFQDRYSRFELSEDFYKKLADSTLADYLAGIITFLEVKEHVKVEEQKWIRKAKRFTLYEDQPIRIK